MGPRQSGDHGQVDLALDRFGLDSSDDIAPERIYQEIAGRLQADAAGTQVEKGILIETADGGAMVALHIVGANFQLRLGVDHRAIREQQILVGLPGVGLLRVRAHEDPAIEDPARPSVEDALVELAAGTVWPGVVDARVVVHMLSAGSKVEAVEHALRSLSIQHRVDIVADGSAAQSARA